MDSTANHASVLAKLMGFYTIEMQTFDAKGGGSSKVKVDLLVMENLFCNFKIAPGRTFDLKGIAGRKVKPAAAAAAGSVAAADEKDKEREREGSKDKDKDGGRRRNRVVSAKPAATAVQKPLFDGEWIEGAVVFLPSPQSCAHVRLYSDRFFVLFRQGSRRRWSSSNRTRRPS